MAAAVLSLEIIQKGEGITLSGRVDAGKYLTAPTVRSDGRSSMGSGRLPHDSTKVFINPNVMAKTCNDVSIRTKEISQVIIPYHKVRGSAVADSV